MKLATYQLPPDARVARIDPGERSGIAWAQFGDQVLLYADDADGHDLATHAGCRALQLREYPVPVQRDHLHVVVQNGRLFQQEHPEVPVILDRGRVLLVDLEPARARQLAEKSLTCFGVLPLEKDHMVFGVRDTAAARAARMDWVADLVNAVSRSAFEATLLHLVSFPTRHSASVHFAEAAHWARDQLAGLQYSTRSQRITVNGSASWNVIATKKGEASRDRDMVLITAHLDSINLAGGATAPAPGADDNGSGSAGLLEIARVLAPHRSQHDLCFILFGGEEQGLFGSAHYVASLSASERQRIRAVVNMDMIGAMNTVAGSVMLEGAPVSQRVIDGLATAAATYTDLAVETSLHPFASDHVPFIDAGLPAALTIEGADSANSRVHSAHDTIEHITSDLALDVLRMNVAFLAGEVGHAPPTQV
jgi:hypothetical protein